MLRRPRCCASSALVLAAALVVCPPHAGIARQLSPSPSILPLLPGVDAWTTTLDDTPSAPATADDSRIYVPLGSGHVAAYARETGERIWTASVLTRWPIVTAGDVVLVADDGALRELDSATGVLRRRAPLPGALTAPMTRLDRRLLLVAEPGLVVAWNTDEWREAWRYALRVGSTTAPVISGSGVIVTAGDEVTMLDAASGEPSWTTKLEGTLLAPVAAGERVFVASSTDTLFALDARRGGLAWPPWRGGSDVIGITADRKHVYATGLDNVVRAFDQKTGNRPWQRVLEMRIITAPQLAGDRLLIAGLRPALALVGTGDGNVHGTHALRDLSVVAQPLLLEAARPEPAVTSTPTGERVAASASDPVAKPAPASAPVGIVVITRDNDMIGIRPQPPAAPATPTTPAAPPADAPDAPAQDPAAAGVSARERRRMPSSMRSADGSENDSRIVS